MGQHGLEHIESLVVVFRIVPIHDELRAGSVSRVTDDIILQ